MKIIYITSTGELKLATMRDTIRDTVSGETMVESDNVTRLPAGSGWQIKGGKVVPYSLASGSQVDDNGSAVTL
jgi:hypothetical protein